MAIDEQSGKTDGAGNCYLSAAKIAQLPENVVIHQHNPNAVRHTRSLGDLAGLTDCGVHLVRVEPGHDTTEYHYHLQDEEFLMILSGQGEAEIGGEILSVGQGDFMAFPRNSPPHVMRNRADSGEDLVYLMGGTRSPVDVCTYPKLRYRQYRIDGAKEYVTFDELKKV
ncbi:MAG: cupin domain-containing protein [Rhizobiales bacterium]|nr:cupin domain-containing protein [Hyphomicrobiales bacterium]